MKEWMESHDTGEYTNAIVALIPKIPDRLFYTKDPKLIVVCCLYQVCREKKLKVGPTAFNVHLGINLKRITRAWAILKVFLSKN